MWAFLYVRYVPNQFAIQMAARPEPLPQEIMDAKCLIDERARTLFIIARIHYSKNQLKRLSNNAASG